MPRAPYAPLLWCVVPVPGQRAIPVYLVSDEHEPYLAGAHPVEGGERVGVCDRGAWAIKLWAGSEPRYFAKHLAHEIMHATLTDPESRKGISDMTEERVLCALSNANVEEAFLAMGWTPPDLPAGWRGLAIHARFVRYGRKRRKRAEAA